MRGRSSESPNEDRHWREFIGAERREEVRIERRIADEAPLEVPD
jgi:hypothetical protein